LAHYGNLYVGMEVTNKDVQGKISLILWLFIIASRHFSFGSTKKLHAITFIITYIQVSHMKIIYSSLCKFYIWWRDLIECISLCNLKQGQNVHQWTSNTVIGLICDFCVNQRDWKWKKEWITIFCSGFLMIGYWNTFFVGL
jgi:hypothetical protein